MQRVHNESQVYKWNKEFLEAGKKRLQGDITREAIGDEPGKQIAATDHGEVHRIMVYTTITPLCK